MDPCQTYKTKKNRLFPILVQFFSLRVLPLYDFSPPTVRFSPPADNSDSQQAAKNQIHWRRKRTEHAGHRGPAEDGPGRRPRVSWGGRVDSDGARDSIMMVIRDARRGGSERLLQRDSERRLQRAAVDDRRWIASTASAYCSS
jgi:hypothetical protein